MDASNANESGRSMHRVSVDPRQLEALERLAGVGSVASSVSHEFNNILTTILNQAKLGLRAGDLDAARRSFEKILDSSRRAAKITTGVLALARNRSSRFEMTDLASVVEQVLVVCDKDLRKHKIELICDLSQRPQAEIVPSQIEQIILNLVINARQAMNEGGTFKIGVTENLATQMVEISLADSGCGIPPENLPRIFEPFYTTKLGPDDSGQGGSGLGLSLCKEIVSRHHGRIRVDSTVGKGTTFTIKLPKRQPTLPTQQAA
jgi:signal transduction histidine kinase